MFISVNLFPRGEAIEKLELDDDSNGFALLKRLNLAPDVHIITRNKEPMPLDEVLNDGDELIIISVVSGG
jgi:sulfur carrier protein ThiS